MTLKQAAKTLHLSPRKLQSDIASGALACVRFGRAVRFLPADLDAYIMARRIQRRRQRQ